MPALVFLSYAPEDEAHRATLEKHLAPLMRDGVLTLSYAGQRDAGLDLVATSNARLGAAALVLLLVSADYLASRDCQDEMLRALELARNKGIRVIPILLRPCHHERESITWLQSLPSDGRPITTWPSTDGAWKDVAKGIDQALTGGESSDHEQPRSAAVSRPDPTSSDRKGRLDDETILLLARLEDARTRRRVLQDAGAKTDDVDDEIIDLKRKLREGGRVKQGDILSGRYSLLQRIGRGGFATVWEAEDREQRRRVAIKVLHSNLAEDNERRDRFFRGARVMAELRHDSVVRIFEAEAKDGGFHYFVMELVTGGDLQHAVIEGRFPRDRTVPLILRVGEALAEAHALGYIHRDVKPANILLDAEGSPKLSDFDLVGGGDTTGGTRTGAMGSFVYAAPELLHQPQDADARADVFGLGMTAVFCFYGRNLPASAFQAPEPFVQGLALGPLERVLIKAVHWDLPKRHASMTVFCDAVKDLIAPKALLPPTPHEPFMTRPPEPRKQALTEASGLTGDAGLPEAEMAPPEERRRRSGSDIDEVEAPSTIHEATQSVPMSAPEVPRSTSKRIRIMTATIVVAACSMAALFWSAARDNERTDTTDAPAAKSASAVPAPMDVTAGTVETAPKSGAGTPTHAGTAADSITTSTTDTSPSVDDGASSSTTLSTSSNTGNAVLNSKPAPPRPSVSSDSVAPTSKVLPCRSTPPADAGIDECAIKRSLELKVLAGKASVGEIRMLKAICSHLGDRECRDRAAAMLKAKLEEAK